MLERDFNIYPGAGFKGYQAENPNIALLRLRSFTIGRKLKDDEVLGPGALKKIADLIGVATPFVRSTSSMTLPWARFLKKN